MKRWGLGALVGLLLGAASAAAEPVDLVCRLGEAAAPAWRFTLDAARQTVAIDAPVNWTWVTAESVLFLHAATLHGRQYATQTYTLDRRTLSLEVCDFTGGADQPVACQAGFRCRKVEPPAVAVHRSAAEALLP